MDATAVTEATANLVHDEENDTGVDREDGLTRNNSRFQLAAMDLATKQVQMLTDTQKDESPSFAPNSRLLVYATIFQGRESLMTTTLDGRIKARLAGQGGDIREPHWGPVRK